jgi:hypothetical protein
MSKSPSKIPSLTKRQIAYCTLRASGENKVQSYLKAGYKSPNSTQAGSSACKLENDSRINSYIETLKEASFLKTALSFAEKRAYLARAVRADVSNADADLIQEVREEVDAEGNVKRVKKMVSKLEALNIDNKMAGDLYSDREPQANNPFLFIVNLSKTGATLVSPSLTSGSPVIDAELVQDSVPDSA